MNITRLNLTNVTLLIRLYKIFIRQYMDYACTALTALNKTQKKTRLEVIKNRCLRYVRMVVDSNCISNDELRSYCNVVIVEQRILALASTW